jgi:3-hydroxypropanoate dehydrogenase
MWGIVRVAMSSPLADASLELLFLEARTHRAWDGTPVTDDELRKLYDLVKLAPTGNNSSPARFVFVRSPAAKERLLPALARGNVEPTRAAPVTVIVAQDSRFYDWMVRLSPGSAERTKAAMEADPGKAERLAFQGSSLEGGYLILAARAMGLDVGPMGGFDAQKVDAEFFPDGRWRSNFLLNLGHGVREKLSPRAARLTFEEACQIL